MNVSMKCALCGNKIEENFLNKIIGSYIKNKSGKKKVICPDCQKKYSVAEIKDKL
jgi:hypothetical protein